MKTAVYIENGVHQIVLTPENEWEKDAISSITDDFKFHVRRGQFYECAGGWIRESSQQSSLILTTIEKEGQST